MKEFWGKRNKFTKEFLKQGKDIIVYNSNPCKIPKLDCMESVKTIAQNQEEARKNLESLK